MACVSQAERSFLGQVGAIGGKLVQVKASWGKLQQVEACSGKLGQVCASWGKLLHELHTRSIMSVSPMFCRSMSLSRIPQEKSVKCVHAHTVTQVTIASSAQSSSLMPLMLLLAELLFVSKVLLPANSLLLKDLNALPMIALEALLLLEALPPPLQLHTVFSA